MLWFVLCFIVGFVGGFLGGLLGVGGGIVILPFLLFVLNFPVDIAVSVNITAVVFTALSGSIAHYKMGNVRVPVIMQVLPAGIVGSVIGSLLFNVVRSFYKCVLEGLLGIAFAYISVRMFYESIRGKSISGGSKVRGCKASLVLYGFITGLVAGLLGIGGGFILVPVLTYVLGLPLREAVGTALASWLGVAAVSSLFKIVEGTVNIVAALLVGIGATLGAQAGARALTKVPQRVLKLMFAVLFMYVAIRLLMKSVMVIIL